MQFLLRWANRSGSNQDWQISNGDTFTLLPDYVREVNINFPDGDDYELDIAVSTDSRFAAAQLSFIPDMGAWTLTSNSPNEWQLAQGNGIVTVRCLLENAANDAVRSSTEELSAKGGGGYPAYQLYEDNTGTTYCSSKKLKSHAEGNAWIKACLTAHPGTSCDGKPWISNQQSGTIWG